MKISVVLPLYNKAPYLQETLDSVFAQTYPIFEVIVVDDGSSDESIDIARRYQGVTVVTQRNQGPSAARNFGVRLAQGDWIALLDADDIWVPEHLSSLVALSKNTSEASVLGSGYRFAYAPARDSKQESKGEQSNISDMHLVSAKLAYKYAGELSDYFAACCHFDLPLTASSVLIQRSNLLAVKGFNTAMRTGEDQDLWARLAVRSFIAVTPQETVTYRIGHRSALGHHIVLEPAPQLNTYHTLLAQPQCSRYHTSIRYLAHLSVLSCVKQRLQNGQRRAARTLLKTHWAVQADHWYFAALLLSVMPSGLVKRILACA